MKGIKPRATTLPPRFWAKVHKDRFGCWMWIGAVDSRGYGRFFFNSQNARAYHLAWEDHYGTRPVGVELHHLCYNKTCVNPLHLQPLTRAEHVLLGNGVSGRNARVVSCPHGHPLEWNAGHTRRFCKTCHQQQGSRRYYRQREEIRKTDA